MYTYIYIYIHTYIYLYTFHTPHVGWMQERRCSMDAMVPSPGMSHAMRPKHMRCTSGYVWPSRTSEWLVKGKRPQGNTFWDVPNHGDLTCNMYGFHLFSSFKNVGWSRDVEVWAINQKIELLSGSLDDPFSKITWKILEKMMIHLEAANFADLHGWPSSMKPRNIWCAFMNFGWGF